LFSLNAVWFLKTGEFSPFCVSSEAASRLTVQWSGPNQLSIFCPKCTEENFDFCDGNWGEVTFQLTTAAGVPPLHWKKRIQRKENYQVSQRTFSIIKPDAVRKGHTAAILAEIEKAGFKIIAVKKLSISKTQAEGFYYVHKERPFFGSLTGFMSSGPIFPLVLEKENAIADLRKLMGATNPANAEDGTIRKKYAGSIEENAIHGSDGEETAQFEIGYFFAGYELA
jgi:nucleoside-diphosphate kinase